MPHATDLHTLGYTDLVEVRKGEKRPVRVGWETHVPSVDECHHWDNAQTNVGLRGDRFPGIDIDFGQNAEEANEVVEIARRIMGPAPLRYSPKPGSRLLVYKLDGAAFRKIVLTTDSGAVEVLGRGRQYVVQGLHPAGGMYSWAKRPLWEVPLKFLTKVSAAKVDEFLEEVQRVFGGTIRKVRDHADLHVAAGDLVAPSDGAVKEFLAGCPNTDAFVAEAFPDAGDSRDTWVSMGMAVKGAGGTVEDFVEWTSRYADGPVDLDLARSAFAGFNPSRYGWPTLDRIRNTQITTPDEVFGEDALEGTPPLPRDRVEEILTDAAICRTLADQLRMRCAYVRRAWIVWNGSKWIESEAHANMLIRDRMQIIARSFNETSRGLVAAAKDQKSDTGKAYAAKAGYLLSVRGARDYEVYLRAVLTRDSAEFDQNMMALNTPGGMVDLMDGSVRPTESADLVTRCTSTAPVDEYDPAKAPNWEAFLEYLSEGDQEYRDFLRRYCGYSLTGSMAEKKLLFIWGSNSNTGKSTFVNAVSDVLGDYHSAVDVNMFLRRQTGSDMIAQLSGARLVTASEPAAGRQWDDEVVKAITGGDQIEATQKYRSSIQYRPQFKIIIAGNNEPELGDVDGAMLQRVLIGPMNRPVDNPDYALPDKLRAESDQILRWMIDGAVEWQQRGLDAPKRVTDVTDEYAQEEDRIASWLEDEVEFTEGAFTSTEDLFNSYKTWLLQQGQRWAAGQLTQTKLTRDLVARQVEMSRIYNVQVRKARRQFRGFTGMNLQEVVLP
jgi:P4 family phage/plasmid primase-like protien